MYNINFAAVRIEVNVWAQLDLLYESIKVFHC